MRSRIAVYAAVRASSMLLMVCVRSCLYCLVATVVMTSVRVPSRNRDTALPCLPSSCSSVRHAWRAAAPLRAGDALHARHFTSASPIPPQQLVSSSTLPDCLFLSQRSCSHAACCTLHSLRIALCCCLPHCRGETTHRRCGAAYTSITLPINNENDKVLLTAGPDALAHRRLRGGKN